MNLVLRPALYGIGLAVLWMVLAVLNEGITYHLAPVLVGLVVPIGVALQPKARPSHVIIGGVASAAIGLISTTILALLDRMSGPAIPPFDGALTESVLLAIAGAVVGIVLGSIALARR